MAFTYNLSTNVGKVRNLVHDVTESTAIFSDDEITSILNLHDGDIFMAASTACLKIAMSKALTAKMRRAGDYWEDDREVMKHYREMSKVYREASENVPADADVEVVYTDFNYNQILQNKSLRNELPDV